LQETSKALAQNFSISEKRHISMSYTNTVILIPLQATLTNLLTYLVLRPTQPPTISGVKMSSSLPCVGYGAKV